MDRETTQTVKAYVRAVRRSYPDARLYLFGSRARNDHWVTSDYDILVVSKRFAGSDPASRMKPLLKLWRSRRDLEVVCLTPEEIRNHKKTSPLLRLALREKVVLN